MQGQGNSAQIIWVMAERTDAGKTAVAVALLDAFNQSGRRAMGFKPFGGAALSESYVAAHLKHPDQASKLYGPDAISLLAASCVTSPELVEVVHPSHRLSVRGKCILVRQGAHVLGNRTILAPVRGTILRANVQARRLARCLDVAAMNARWTMARNARRIDQMAVAHVQASYEYIAALGPDVIVQEGASMFAPIWANAPPPDHLIAITGNRLHVFPNVRGTISTDGLSIGIGPKSGTPHFTEVVAQLAGQPSFGQEIQQVPGDQVRSYMRDLVGRLMAQAGVL